MSLIYDGEVRIKKLGLGPYDANCYVVACPETGESVIIDTPAEATRILAETEGTKVRYILITHAHPDHLGALREVKHKLGAPVANHPLEAGMLPLPPDLHLNDGDTVRFGTVALKVIHAPGHTKGSICLLTGRHLFSGDTIFPGGPGRTATPADFDRIVNSLTDKIFVLPDHTLVYPGHGLDTTLDKEKAEFTAFSSRPRRPGLCGDVLWLSS
jgi:glyoxylase-like metal-dependent hydrolase (beta-lactamase superfamily II)